MELLALDTETTGVDFFHGCKPFMVTACDGAVNYIASAPVDAYTREVWWDREKLDNIQNLIHRAKRIVFHNANFDIRALSTIGIDISCIWDKLEDTMIAAHCIHSAKETNNKDSKKRPVGRSLKLKDLCIEYLDYWDDDEHILAEIVQRKVAEGRKLGYRVAREGDPHFPGLKKTTTSFWKQDYWLAPEACETYAVRDVERTWLLWQRAMKPGLYVDQLYDQYEFRRSLLKIAYDMQSYGRYFDAESAREMLSKLRTDAERIRQNIRLSVGITYKFDPNKPDHLIDLIHKRLNIPVRFKTPKGKARMNKDAVKAYIEMHDCKQLRDLSVYKRKLKQAGDIDSYLKWIDEHSRTHSSLNITGTRETRQSSSNPNDQNISKVLLRLLVPPPGKLILAVDMVNIELRIWAYLVGSQKLIELFERGESVHLLIMSLIFPLQHRAYCEFKDKPKSEWTSEQSAIADYYTRVKNGNFSRIYGATDRKTNETYHGSKTSINYCGIIDQHVPEIKQFFDKCRKECFECYDRYKQFSIKTLSGYRLSVPPDEPYKAANFKIQGTAGIIMSQAQVLWSRHPLYRMFDCHMTSQVHDGLDTEIPICEDVPTIVEAKLDCIRKAGMMYIPTCDATYSLIYNKADETNYFVQKYITNGSS